MGRAIRAAGIRALALTVPTQTRTITLPSGQSALRHVLPPGESGLNLDKQAAESVLRAAGMVPSDIDLVLSASFPALPEPCIGNATPVAWDLGMDTAAAWNVETACAGGLIGLRSACNEVALGHYDNVLVIVGCPYSHTVEANHPAYDVVGDAAFAMIIGPTCEGQELLGTVIRNSGPTCPLVSWSVDLKVPSGIRLEVDGRTAGKLENWALGHLPGMSAELLQRAGVTAADVDHWVSNAPTPKFVDRALVAMGADPSQGVNTNRMLGNIGPALIGASLFYNAILRDFQPGDLVVCCSVGSEASLALAIMRWPENVALGGVPDHASIEQMRAYEDERLGASVG